MLFESFNLYTNIKTVAEIETIQFYYLIEVKFYFSTLKSKTLWFHNNVHNYRLQEPTQG